jgi:putative endonuclease
MYSAYILFSEKLSKRYVGSSKDPYERVKEHNKGKSKFTSCGIPWALKYIEYYETRKEAMTRERFLKTGAGRIFMKRVFKETEGYPDKEMPDNCLQYKIL